MKLMKVLRVAKAGVTHPFGDARTVQQAFPSALSTKEADPFLMCDYFDMVEPNASSHQDDDDDDHYPVDWHPHRGFDIASYLKSGVGRHADSLGNRETFDAPGMQWMNTGSGVMHAEGGGSKKQPNQRTQGFQIWVNVPARHKMDKPDYGTVTPDQLPALDVGHGAQARVLAGTMFDQTGPFRTKQDVQMVDVALKDKDSWVNLEISRGLDTALLYVYQGSLKELNSSNDDADADDETSVSAETQSVVLLDANNDDERGIRVKAGSPDTGILLFAGKKLKEPIAWLGPIVMNTQQQIAETLLDIRSGNFPPVRVDWDYKRAAARPQENVLIM